MEVGRVNTAAPGRLVETGGNGVNTAGETATTAGWGGPVKTAAKKEKEKEIGIGIETGRAAP